MLDRHRVVVKLINESSSLCNQKKHAALVMIGNSQENQHAVANRQHERTAPATLKKRGRYVDENKNNKNRTDDEEEGLHCKLRADCVHVN